MMKNSSTMLFILTMITGVIMSLSSNNWIMIWCGLEISLISFIPMMVSKSPISSESTMKYFIVQSISSSMLMLSLLIMIMKGDYNYDYMMMTSLLIKMGVSPFHNWVLTVLEGLQPIMVMFMLTINKIVPMMMISYLSTSIILIVGVTIITGSVMGLNQSSLNKLIGYSSIFNMGFLIVIAKYNMMWVCYITIYSIMLIMLLMLMKTNKFMNQMIFSEMILPKLYFWITLLSMGGMPPLMGFSIKYMVMMHLIELKMTTMVVFMTIMSLLVMFFYLRMTFLSTMIFAMKNKMLLFKFSTMSTLILYSNMFTLPILLMTKYF
uniref:NADH-ubiquinone oxidoreductase chain 2 n=1 Tax=Hiratettix distanti TaxID=2893146 RepID=A0A9E7BY85_9HEMI|nr:NADH dehydrogenase subunit 2 [Hiratettix distanti]UGN61536.1 NADH dehydrogenase subunit 2 [Hiratettix distanti]